MATYAIGDVQGCFASLERLVSHVQFDHRRDQLWFVGDLVNRGPCSVDVLRYIKSLGRAARVVLGNHDIFLLAVAHDVVAIRQKDTIQNVLVAPDRDELIGWLRQQPLHHRSGPYFMVHAGLLPQWTIEQGASYAREVETALAGPEYKTFLHALFHGTAPNWHPSIKGQERLVAITRALTRLRTCTAAGALSSFSGPLDQIPAGYVPWFRAPERQNASDTVIFGHWAALGLHMESHVMGIDSGCVYGRQLTAVRLEDRHVFQVNCVDAVRRA